MKPATPLTQPTSRRVEHESGDIVNVVLIPPDTLEIHRRKPRQKDEEVTTMTISSLLEEPKTKVDTQFPTGMGATVDLWDLETYVVGHPRLTDHESAKLFNIVREMQTGKYPE
jgi:hypothetical protein